jgi:RimJ/RimL family protein N-acetyltransferase
MNTESMNVYSPFPMNAVPRLWNWTKKYRYRIADDFGHESPEAFTDALLKRMQGGLETWAVESGGELGGFVCVEPVTPVAVEFHVLFKPPFFTKSIIDPALGQVFAKLFERDGIEKVTTHIFEDNSGLMTMVKRLGGKTEGRLRNHTKRQGKLMNVTAMAILKEEFTCSVSA